ncbi:MAG: hypothetical protein P8Z74_21410 [Acidobacteriota bacterium]
MGLLLLTAVAWVVHTSAHNLHRLSLDWFGVLRRLCVPTLTQEAPLLVLGVGLLGIYCLRARVRRVRPTVGDEYSVTLSSAFLGPICGLAVFSYDPLRYYVPVIPVGILLAVHALRKEPQADVSTASAEQTAGTRPLLSVFCTISELLFTWIAGFALAGFLLSTVLGLLPIELGTAPGISYSTQFRFLSAPILVGGAALWWITRKIRDLRALKWAGGVVLALMLVLDAGRIVAFLVHPSFQAREIRETLAATVPRGASVGGDWAPFLTLGTDLHALYMNHSFNAAARIASVRPDFFLFSETRDSEFYRAAIQKNELVQLGAPVFECSYAGRQVVLYPIHYSPQIQSQPEWARPVKEVLIPRNTEKF